MVKGRKHQNVSCEQWTVKGFKILINVVFKNFLKLINFLFVEMQLCGLDRNVRHEAGILNYK